MVEILVLSSQFRVKCLVLGKLQLHLGIVADDMKISIGKYSRALSEADTIRLQPLDLPAPKVGYRVRLMALHIT